MNGWEQTDKTQRLAASLAAEKEKGGRLDPLKIIELGAQAGYQPETIYKVWNMVNQYNKQAIEQREQDMPAEEKGRRSLLENIGKYHGTELAGPGLTTTPQDYRRGRFQVGDKTYGMPPTAMGYTPDATPREYEGINLFKDGVERKARTPEEENTLLAQGWTAGTTLPEEPKPKKILLKSWDFDGAFYEDPVTMAEYPRKRKELEALGRVFREPLAKKKLERELDTSDKSLKSLASRYDQAIGRYYSAKRGVGQYIKNVNREEVAAEALQAAENVAVQYVKSGGKAEDLGITAESIRADFKAGRIDEKKALHLLRELFKMK